LRQPQRLEELEQPAAAAPIQREPRFRHVVGHLLALDHAPKVLPRAVRRLFSVEARDDPTSQLVLERERIGRPRARCIAAIAQVVPASRVQQVVVLDEQRVRDAHHLSVHVGRRVEQPDRVPEALRHLVYAVGGVVFGRGFDPVRLETLGDPVPVIEGVARSDPSLTGVTQFSSAENGTLIYVSGPVSPSMIRRDVVFVDRQTLAVQSLKLPPAVYEYPRVSPDGRRLAVGTDDGNEAIIWVYDLSGASARRRLTLGGRNQFPIWSPDSQRLSFTSDREGDLALYWQRADGAGPPERLTRPERGVSHVPQSWAPNGKTLLFRAGEGSSFSLWTLSMIDRQLARFDTVATSGRMFAAFSPDGRWIAYDVGDRTMSLFVQPFPVSGAQYEVVALGGFPFWSPDGKELFFETAGTRLWALPVATTPSLTFGHARQIATSGLLGRGANGERSIDITPDGKRLVGVLRSDQVQSAPASRPQINVVENWLEELKGRVPTR